MGFGTAWGGRLPCKQEIRWVQFPQGPLYNGAYPNGEEGVC